jgi:hypothetical protein
MVVEGRGRIPGATPLAEAVAVAEAEAVAAAAAAAEDRLLLARRPPLA